MAPGKRESAHRDLLLRYRGHYDAQIEIMQESFARMDQLQSRELARERELIEDDIASHILDDCCILDDESYECEGEEILFGGAVFRRMMRRSHLVTIITYFESSLGTLTSLLLNETNARRVGTSPGLNIRDFGSNNVCNRCRIALTKYVGLTDNQALWSYLADFVKIRNAVVHSAGIIPVINEGGQYVPEDRKLKGAHERLSKSGFSLTASGEMIIEPQLHDMLLETVRDYLRDICDKGAEHFSPPKAINN